ncbi:hypothetical protein MATL_G00120040 [Megalops atlanticus]|uniref:MHC class I-like antigen recognition-like domain-containing protein n=1 Tax=Megalops atlanticus TaxID=7932 RepID=A0A9D3Q2S7_MEGAT|nr:hypothetical protein MATL_G00120040 [Megalops atlanticus]
MEYFKVRFLMFSLLFRLTISLQKETVIQFVYTEVVGRAETPVATVVLNGVPVLWSDVQDRNILHEIFIKTKHDPFFVNSLKIMVDSSNHTTVSNHTYRRLRECQLDGHRVLSVSDQVQYDGTRFLSLDKTTDTWMAAVPQARALQELWDSDKARTQRERMSLERACIQLLKDIKHSKDTVTKPEKQEALSFWLPVLAALLLVGLILVSILVFKKQGSKGSGYAGAAVGSIIHYPPNLSEVAQEAHGYHAL